MMRKYELVSHNSDPEKVAWRFINSLLLAHNVTTYG